MWNKVTRVKYPVDPASNKHFGGIIMICVGIDVAKDKHDCFILTSEGDVLAEVFTTSQTTQKDLTPCCKPFVAVLVRQTK